jgi:hypothetical protein
MKKDDAVYVTRSEFNEALKIQSETLKLIYLVMVTQEHFILEFNNLLEEK